jgi:hypothetical protein
MAQIPLIPKNVNPKISSEQIRAAIRTFRKQFRGHRNLAKLSDEEIQERVEKFLTSKQVFKPKLASPPVTKLAAAAIVDTCPFAIGVVIVDCIFMILGFVGLHASNSERLARVAALEIGEQVARSLPGWAKLIKALNEAGSATARAVAVFKIASAAYKAGMFGAIIKSIASSMKPWDWVIAGVAAVAQIGLLFLTDGAAFIAELALNATAVAYVVSDSVKAVQVCSR